LSIRRKFSVFIGLTQSVIGTIVTVFAYLLYHNVFEMQAVFNVPQKDVQLFMLILIVFGLLSIISGLFLFNER